MKLPFRKSFTRSVSLMITGGHGQILKGESLRTQHDGAWEGERAFPLYLERYCIRRESTMVSTMGTRNEDLQLTQTKGISVLRFWER